MVDKGRDVINRQKDTLNDAIEAGKQAYREKVEPNGASQAGLNQMPEETFRWVITGGVAIATLCILTMAVVAILLYGSCRRCGCGWRAWSRAWNRIIDTVREMARRQRAEDHQHYQPARSRSRPMRRISPIVAKDQAHRFAEVGRDIADRTKAQIARVDAVVDETVEQVHHAGDNVKAAVLKPVREASAVFAGVKAAVVSLWRTAAGLRSTTSRRTKKCSFDGKAGAGIRGAALASR